MKKFPAFLNTPLRIVTALGAVILVTELLIMLLIETGSTYLTGIPQSVWTLFDPVALTAIVAPVIYFLIFLPLNQQAKLERQLDELRRVQKVEAALLKSETKFRTVYESSSDAIMLLDEKEVFDCNEATLRMFGCHTRDEFISKYPAELSPPTQPGGEDSMSLANERIAMAFKNGGNRFEWIHRRLDGADFPAEVLLTTMELDGKAVLQATVRNISGRKLAENKIHELNEELETKVQERTKQLLEVQEELMRKEKLAVLGQVAGSVGHELRNPLGVMSNAVYFLQTVLSDADDTTKEYLNIIKSEIAGSERIVSDLLDAVRTQPPHREIVGVAELIGQTLHKFSVPAFVTVKLDIPAMVSKLQVDSLQIHQVFRNLISNGIEAMPEGGTLEVRAGENMQDGTVAVSVHDSGIGIAPEILPKLFQPLFSTKARGIGLGLVVVKNLTEANGGRVEVQSEPGQGTTFTVIFPVQPGSIRGN